MYYKLLLAEIISLVSIVCLIFANREFDMKQQHSTSIMFIEWMEVHSGKIEPREDSKSVILFVSKPPSMLYKDLDNYDNADLSDVVVGENRYIPIVDSFTYIGSVVTRNCR